MRRLAAVGFAVVLFAAPASAAVDEVQIHVRGLACPFCVYGIEKNIKKVEGVVSVETTIRTGLVRIQVEPGAVLDPARFQEAITKGGFTLDRIEATVTGRLVTRDDRPGLEVPESGQIFLLLEDGGEHGTYEALSQRTLEKLEKSSEDGRLLLSITGRVHGHTATPPGLSVERFEVAG